MATLTIPVTFSFRDAKGWIGRMRTFISGNGSTNTASDYDSKAATLLGALQALTNCATQAGPITTTGLVTLSYGTNAEYPAEWMKAVMQFSTDSGQISRFKVPAPKIALFDTDGITILNDGTQAAIVAYVNAVKNADASGTYVSNQAGFAFTHFEGGILRIGKQPRRFNERIKSSHLVAGEGE